MSLKDYEVTRDKFEFGDCPNHFDFPCCVCEHRNVSDRDEPCRTCDHNMIAQPDVEPDRTKPPCLECGAMTEIEAETLCICAGDKDHCHGCELWP